MKHDKEKIYIRPPKLSSNFIRRKAEEFRNRHVDPVDLIPVPIIEIVELKLMIRPIPIAGLMQKIDIDGFLTNDLKKIVIDLDIYMDDRKENRVRFTYAHEVGHLVLHENEIKKCKFRTVDDWIYFREDFSEEDLSWFELQAHEFAGRLLVPRDILRKEIYREIKGKEKNLEEAINLDEEKVIESISRVLSPKFKVSNNVIEKRIIKENIWTEIKQSIYR